jgi:DNA-binding transcriptional ArsR family regulator
VPRGPVSDPGDPLARLTAALGHPLRIRIIRALVAGPGSATSLSRAIDDSTVHDLFYHLTVLERLRIVRLYRLRPARGAREKIFELRSPARWGDVWKSLPPSIVAGLQNASFGNFVELATATFDSRPVERDPRTVFDGCAIRTDEQGYREIGDLLRAALTDVERIRSESRMRLDESDGAGQINAVIGAAAFEAPPPDWWETQSVSRS